jgi:hypothetical protein
VSRKRPARRPAAAGLRVRWTATRDGAASRRTVFE